MSSSSSSKKRKRGGISSLLTMLAVFLIGGALLYRGWDFYFLSLDDKVDHPDYRQLRPSGLIGYGYGLAGTFLIFTNLLYLARRKLAAWNLGSMRTWLDLHVFTGLVGAMFILFHSAFQARSTMAMATASSLIIVVVTGLIGRYLYALTPSTDQAGLYAAIGDLNNAVPGIGENLSKAIAAFPPVKLGATPTLLRTLRALPHWRKAARDRREAVELIAHNHPAMSQVTPERRSIVGKLIKRVANEAGSQVRGVAATAFLRSWRSLHRFFAIMMLLTVTFHIAVAIYYGYRWIFSE